MEPEEPEPVVVKEAEKETREEAIIRAFMFVNGMLQYSDPSCRYDEPVCVRTDLIWDYFTAALMTNIRGGAKNKLESFGFFGGDFTAMAYWYQVRALPLIAQPRLLVQKTMQYHRVFMESKVWIAEVLETAVVTAFLVARGKVMEMNVQHPACKCCYKFHPDLVAQFITRPDPPH